MELSTKEVAQPTETEQATFVWSACLDLIRDGVNTQSFKTWFEPIMPLGLNGGKLTIQVPSQFFYDWLEEHYYNLISATVTRVLGQGAELEYVVRQDESVIEAVSDYIDTSMAKPEKNTQPQQQLPQRPGTANVSVSGGNSRVQSYLNPRYTFDNYIKGESNQLARAAASAVANNPGGTSFNP
ncbi:MAG: DnaA N-terminal domain-containing protein, partial [Bacteroidota bacterium]